MTSYLARTAMISGTISGALTIGMTILWSRSEPSSGALGMPIGYLIMLVTLSIIFVGVKRYRDVNGGGVISFARASMVGLAICAVATLVYILAWEGYMMATDYSFYESYIDGAIAQLSTQDLGEAVRSAKEAEFERFRTLFQMPLFRLFVSATEILPVGLVVSLLSATLLRNPNFMPLDRA